MTDQILTASGHNSRAFTVYPERYGLIDAWRGLAALAVVVHHCGGPAIGAAAVMVFFVISGYCIAGAADSCQRKNLGFTAFMWRRFRRIYPPYALALLFWTLTRLIKLKQSGVNDLARPWTQWVQNITLTQWLSLLRNPLPEAPQNPSLFVAAFWSLCYEEQFYLVFALMILLCGLIGLSVRAMVMLLLPLALLWNTAFPQLCYGLFIEYWAMFAVGSLVFYALCRARSRSDRMLLVGAIIAITALSAFLNFFAGIAWKISPDPENPFRIAWHELLIASGFALLLIAMRPLDERFKKFRPLSLPLHGLGMITYSLYLIHQFNLALVATVASKCLAIIRWPDPPAWVFLTVQCAGHIALASVFWYFCERPFLNRSLLPSDRAGRPKDHAHGVSGHASGPIPAPAAPAAGS